MTGQNLYPEDVWEGPGNGGLFLRVAPVRRSWTMRKKKHTLRFGLPRMCIVRIGDAFRTVFYSQAVESLDFVEDLDGELFVAVFRAHTTHGCVSLLTSLFCD